MEWAILAIRSLAVLLYRLMNYIWFKPVPSTKSTTSLNLMPLEILDIILLKSCLLWILNSSTEQRDEEVIRSLTSVDDCFYQRVTRSRFKKTIWRYLKNFYNKTRRRFAIIRNNRHYFVENIQPNDKLVSFLLSLNCITQKESDLLRRQHSKRDKNNKLLNLMRTFDEEKFSDLVWCLRQTNQKTASSVIENGGGVIKIEVHFPDAKCTTSLKTTILEHNNKIAFLRNGNEPSKIINRLTEKGIEIINSQVKTQAVVIWIRCRSQQALKALQTLYDSNGLRNVLFDTIPSPSTSKMINVDRNQFQKTVVVCRPTPPRKMIRRIDIPGKKVVGVTGLRNKIYIICRSNSAAPHVIQVFDNRTPYKLRKKIELTEIKDPFDSGSWEMESCLYVSDRSGKCVWKITRESFDEHKIIKWLTTDYTPHSLSVSSDGQLLMVDRSSSILCIYGSDAELIRYIPLPRDIMQPLHAVKTSVGNLVIIHSRLEERDDVEYDEDEDDDEGDDDEEDATIEPLTFGEEVDDDEEDKGTLVIIHSRVEERDDDEDDEDEDDDEDDDDEDDDEDDDDEDDDDKDDYDEEDATIKPLTFGEEVDDDEEDKVELQYLKLEEEENDEEGHEEKTVEKPMDERKRFITVITERQRYNGPTGTQRWIYCKRRYGPEITARNIQHRIMRRYPIFYPSKNLQKTFSLYDRISKTLVQVVMKDVVSELTGDGQMVVRRFIPSNKTQELRDPCYLTLDSDDRVMVADTRNGRAILFDSNLKWIRSLVATKENKEDPYRLFYDEENKRLFVGADQEAFVFTIYQDHN